MFERLILCEYAVCDLTSANANAFYELGLQARKQGVDAVRAIEEELGNIADQAVLLFFRMVLKL
jgi:hypothetical protein